MDVAQMFLLFQLQQMNASWKTPKSDQTGSSEAGETGDSSSQLFAALFQAALGRGTKASQGLVTAPTTKAENVGFFRRCYLFDGSKIRG